MAKDLCFTARLEAFWAAGHRGLLQYHQLLWESCLSGPERCKPKKAHVIVLSASPQYSPDVFNMFQQCKYDNYIHAMLHSIFNIYTSSARTSRGRKFQRKKTISQRKKFAYRMRARRPTSAMPKPFLSCSMVVMWPVLMSRSCLRREMK